MYLFELAQLGNMPQKQFMDSPTLEWIRSNMPQFKQSYKNIAIPWSLLSETVTKYAPPAEWFLNQDGIDSIHGLRHILRVLVNTRLICWQLKLPDDEMLSAVLSAVVHDLRRENDNADTSHGIRAAEWFKLNQQMVEKYINTSLSVAQVQTIEQAITAHELPYAETPVIEATYSATDVMKTADALDRYRQPKLKWWINDSYLRLIPEEWMKSFAFELMSNSEAQSLKGDMPVETVLKSLTSMQNAK